MDSLANLFFRYSPSWMFVPAYNIIMSRRKHTTIRRNREGAGWLIIGTDPGDITLMSPTPKFLNVKAKLFSEKFDRCFRINPGDTVLDVGACIGDTTVFMAARAGEKGATIAIEPHPTNCEYLKKNLAKFNNVEVHQVAASNEHGVTHFHTHFSLTGHSLEANEERHGMLSVETDTIDHIIGSRHVDFAKIDVQGWELPVLQGATNLLKSTPKVMVETHYRYSPKKRTYPAVIELLQKQGYKTEFAMENDAVVYGTKAV